MARVGTRSFCKHEWAVVKSGDYRRWACSKCFILRSRVLTDAQPGEIVDHKNGDTLDDSPENLRKCTLAQNRMNCKPKKGKQFKGTFKGRNDKWRAKIMIDGRVIHLGTYSTEVEAAHVYDQAASQYFGEYAYLNFPEGGSRWQIED
jgi:hypothetical protein